MGAAAIEQPYAMVLLQLPLLQFLLLLTNRVWESPAPQLHT
jgi:hypothetical protein